MLLTSISANGKLFPNEPSYRLVTICCQILLPLLHPFVKYRLLRDRRTFCLKHLRSPQATKLAEQHDLIRPMVEPHQHDTGDGVYCSTIPPSQRLLAAFSVWQSLALRQKPGLGEQQAQYASKHSSLLL
jgi:hypothetical protein